MPALREVKYYRKIKLSRRLEAVYLYHCLEKNKQRNDCAQHNKFGMSFVGQVVLDIETVFFSLGILFFFPRARVGLVKKKNDEQCMRTGPDQGQIGPLLRRGFFCREWFARIFLSCPTPVLSGRISLQPITKLPSSLLKYFAVVLNYLPNEWILRGEAPGYWLRPVLSTRGEQLIPADGRKEETTLPYSFSP